MKHFLLLTIFLIVHFRLEAQHQFGVIEVPIFKSAADSIAYTTTQATFQKMIAGDIMHLSADSVLHELRMIGERSIIGKRKTYNATQNFFPFDSLALIKKPDQITKLSISHVKLKRIPNEVLKCKNLEFLELVNTPIKSLSKLSKLTHLKSIYVLNNQQLKPLKLSKTKSVKTFGMRGEHPSNIPKSFKKLSRLEKLDLADNKLTQFPSGIQGNTNLKEILLGNNNLTLDDGHMEKSASLEKLELQKNKIKIIPSSIGGFPNLKKLTLNFNAIEKVADEISRLRKLEQLSFYNNKLITLPDGVYQLSHLKEIDLYFNQIERIDDRLGNLKALEVLFLSNNRLISLPEVLGSMPNLKELYLSNNRLSDLPKSLSNLHDLRVLRINNNYLTQAPRDLLKLNSIENIDISSNKITELPEELGGLNHLKLLVIINNPWDSQSKERLPQFAEMLRKKDIVVHSD